MITPSFSPTATERVLPALAIDFTTANLDSRITLTRALNTATIINSNGYVQTINANLPRFDYDPIALTCKGLLIEESRTNLIQDSQFTSVGTTAVNNAWYLYNSANISATVNNTTSPANDSTACLAAVNKTTSYQYFEYRTNNNIDGTYAVTVFAKPASSDTKVTVWLGAEANITNGGRAIFTLSGNGTYGNATSTGTGTFVSASISKQANGFYRCTVVVTLASTTNISVQIYPGALNSQTSASQTYLWGAQIEAGSFATSYIPTSGGTATRNADVATMTSTNFSAWWVATRGASIVNYTPKSVSGTSPAIQFDDNTASNLICLRGNTTNPELYIKATTDQAQIDAGTIAANTAYKLGGAWNTNNCGAAINGNAAVDDLSVTVPTVTQARLGCDGTNYLNGWLNKLQYWQVRLTDAELQAFTK